MDLTLRASTRGVVTNRDNPLLQFFDAKLIQKTWLGTQEERPLAL